MPAPNAKVSRLLLALGYHVPVVRIILSVAEVTEDATEQGSMSNMSQIVPRLRSGARKALDFTAARPKLSCKNENESVVGLVAGASAMRPAGKPIFRGGSAHCNVLWS